MALDPKFHPKKVKKVKKEKTSAKFFSTPAMAVFEKSASVDITLREGDRPSRIITAKLLGSDAVGIRYSYQYHGTMRETFSGTDSLLLVRARYARDVEDASVLAKIDWPRGQGVVSMKDFLGRTANLLYTDGGRVEEKKNVYVGAADACGVCYAYIGYKSVWVEYRPYNSIVAISYKVGESKKGRKKAVKPA